MSVLRIRKCRVQRCGGVEGNAYPTCECPWQQCSEACLGFPKGDLWPEHSGMASRARLGTAGSLESQPPLGGQGGAEASRANHGTSCVQAAVPHPGTPPSPLGGGVLPLPSDKPAPVSPICPPVPQAGGPASSGPAARPQGPARQPEPAALPKPTPWSPILSSTSHPVGMEGARLGQGWSYAHLSVQTPGK